MTNERFLYGASVQGIQKFIFQTNELKDIVGASDLVENICKEAFTEFETNGTKIVGAAGNIKYEFNDEESCAKAVKNFNKKVLKMAPGITISQAVVKFEDGNFQKAVSDLELKLRIQRNKPVSNSFVGLIGISRSPKTGMPAVKSEKNELIDEATQEKRAQKHVTSKLCSKCFGEENSSNKYAFNIEDIATKNDWIAVVHADGNGLGKIIKKIGADRDKLKTFSEKLERATNNAAQSAYNYISEEYKFTSLDKIPIRPVILGGDDFTFICRADFAVPYTQQFLQAFEKETQELLGEKLTACAGISFIKSSFPFYYGYDLADKICAKAKKLSRFNNLTSSSLMFHKVSDSYVEDYDTIIKRELTPQEKISFLYGPYFLTPHPDKWTINDLLDAVRKMEQENAIKSHLRQWLTLLNENKEKSDQKISRLKAVVNESKKNKWIDTLTDLSGNSTPVYDILSLFSTIYPVTKSK